MNTIQLHELMVGLKDDAHVRIIQKQGEGYVDIVEGKVKDIDDLKGYHHNNVEGLRYTFTCTYIIEIE